MLRKFAKIILISLVGVTLTACGGGQTSDNTQSGANQEVMQVPDPAPDQTGDGSLETGEAFHIGIVTGSYSQSEDDRRGAEAFQDKYGKDNVILAVYPDNFTDEAETTIGVITGLADDPKMKAIIVNQAVEGTDEAFRRIKEKRPDILCIAGETFDVFEEMGDLADLAVDEGRKQTLRYVYSESEAEYDD